MASPLKWDRVTGRRYSASWTRAWNRRPTSSAAAKWRCTGARQLDERDVDAVRKVLQKYALSLNLVRTASERV
ncbi:MAG: hypothetical protein R2854_01900 [Caldilineaceae bacterium]